MGGREGRGEREGEREESIMYNACTYVSIMYMYMYAQAKHIFHVHVSARPSIIEPLSRHVGH